MSEVDLIRKEIHEKSNKWMDKDQWALYLPPEKKHDLIESIDMTEDHRSFEDVDVVVDVHVDRPTVLPKDVEMVPPKHRLQDNPPLPLVEQMVDAEIKRSHKILLTEPGEEVVIVDYFPYEVRSIEYMIDIDQLSSDLHCPEVQTMLGKAVGEGSDWGFERRGIYWIFTREFNVGDVIQKFKLSRSGPRDYLKQMDIERDIAEGAIELIGGSITESLSAPVEVIEEDGRPPIVATSETPEEVEMDTKTEHVSIGEKRYNLGRMRLGP